MSKEFTETTRVELQHEKKSINEIIKIVYSALEAKGYNPKNQIIGYILSGDPTYITNYNNARGLIRQISRDEILEEFLDCYMKM
ncbi:hypothetical protein HMPREF3188_01243 [Tissierellia bacterium KA00581]|jgi:hypothetical protein|nr:hypothetical protein HMPREF3188_01243 [Tissierellia bacterium KA00581]